MKVSLSYHFYQKMLSHLFSRPFSQESYQSIKAAGIDTDYYKAHSSRGAAVSKAYKSVPLNIVLDAAGWSNAQTFAKHYQKPIEEGSKFAKAILEMHA